MTGDRKPLPFLTTKARESQGKFSPDTRWVAYGSDESGESEIYVRGFDPQTGAATGGKWQVSTGGGSQLHWRADGKELFYFSGRKLMSVDIVPGPAFRAGVPRVLFEAPLYGSGRGVNVHRWDVSPDGRKFLINTVKEDEDDDPITVILNWQSLLKR
jgi:hypothetical protein